MRRWLTYAALIFSLVAFIGCSRGGFLRVARNSPERDGASNVPRGSTRQMGTHFGSNNK